jgi:hypothetical protein
MASDLGVVRWLRALVDREQTATSTPLGGILGKFTAATRDAYLEGWSDGSHEAWEAANAIGEPPVLTIEEEDGRVAKGEELAGGLAAAFEEALIAHLEVATQRAQTQWTALRRLCREEGVDAREVLDRFLSEDAIAEVEALRGPIAPDAIEREHAALRRVLDEMQSRDP